MSRMPSLPSSYFWAGGPRTGSFISVCCLWPRDRRYGVAVNLDPIYWVDSGRVGGRKGKGGREKREGREGGTTICPYIIRSKGKVYV